MEEDMTLFIGKKLKIFIDDPAMPSLFRIIKVTSYNKSTNTIHGITLDKNTHSETGEVEGINLNYMRRYQEVD